MIQIICKRDFSSHGIMMCWMPLVENAIEAGMITREQSQFDDDLEITIEIKSAEF